MKPRAKLIKGALIAGAVFAALFCEWVIARLAGGSALALPVAVFAVTVMLSVLPFLPGLWLALAAGFLLDSAALPPFGATILLFLFLACVMEAVRAVMADRKSYGAKIGVAAGLYLLVYALAPSVRAIAILLKL